MIQETAETLALQALAYVVSEEKARNTFMTQTGLDGAEMREHAGKADFQAGVLDFLTRHEDLLIGFCESVDLAPADISAAHRALSPHAGTWNSS